MRLRPTAWICSIVLVASCAQGSSPTALRSPSPSPAYRQSCVADSALAQPSPATAGISYSTMIVDHALRDYRVYQPPSLDFVRPVPLVLVFHGYPIDAAGFEDVIHFDQEAAAAGFLAVSPDGCHEDWDETAGSSDVHFVSSLMDKLESEFRIDRSRVYAVGASAGGFMAYRLACDLAGRLRAVASVAGSMWWNCAPAWPISVYEIHGTADDNVPYAGGPSTYHYRLMQSVTSVVQRWVTYDGCTGGPASSQHGITKTSLWRQCKDASVVRFDTVVGGHHTWFGSTYDPVPGEPNANQLIWSFFSSLPTPP